MIKDRYYNMIIPVKQSQVSVFNRASVPVDEIHFDLPNYYKPGDGCMSRTKPLKRCDSSLYRHLSGGKIGGQIQNDLVALKVRNGGSQTPDRWLISGRNNQRTGLQLITNAFISYLYRTLSW